MYTPSAFRIEDSSVIRDFIQANNFGILLSKSVERIEDTHTPFLISDDGENLFGLGVRGNVSKSDGRQAGDREIHRCYITRLEGMMIQIWNNFVPQL